MDRLPASWLWAADWVGAPGSMALAPTIGSAAETPPMGPPVDPLAGLLTAGSGASAPTTGPAASTPRVIVRVHMAAVRIGRVRRCIGVRVLLRQTVRR